MNPEYYNPPRRVKSRTWITPAEERWTWIKEILFHEANKNDLLYYCKIHHSLESKYTIKKHYEARCESFTKGQFISKFYYAK